MPEGQSVIATFNAHNFAAATEAKKNGCKPFYWEPYKAFCCGCTDLLHISDQQCSVITDKSANKKRKP